jgi:Holliday junction resolvasome RuvABC endonuclease subunit
MGDAWDVSNCHFRYLTSKKKLVGTFGCVIGDPMPLYENQEDRFDLISDWVIANLKHGIYSPDETYLESYSFASTGKAFSIGENTGILKHKLWTLDLNYAIVPPTVIKKYATGKGNANKEAIEECFLTETGVDFRLLLGQSNKSSNPSSDLIDAYYICKYGFDFTRESIHHTSDGV